MKKLFTNLKVAMTLLLLCGVCSAWAESKTVTYKQSSTSAASVSSGIAPTGSSVTFSNTYTTKDQLTKNNSMTYTLSGFAGCKITSLSMSMHSNKSAGTGKFSLVAGSTTLAEIASNTGFNQSAWYGEWTQSYVTVTPSMNNATYTIQANENVVLTISASANSLFCESITLTYEESTLPAISADNVNLTADATSGEILYSISNPADGKELTAKTTADWISNVAVDAANSKVTFTTEANTGAARNAEITLSYEGASDKIVTVTQSKASTFASLEALVAAGAPASDGKETVTVTLANEVIKSFYTSSGNRNGVFLNYTNTEGKDIEIYCPNVPEAWVAGGTVSGTLENCTWKNYYGTWELCPANWNSLAYTAPATYAINIDEAITNGTVEASATESAAGLEVSLTITPADYYFLESITVTNATTSEEVEVVNNKFTMPASDVTVSAAFNAIPTHEVKFYVNGTQTGETQNVYEGKEIDFPEDPVDIGAKKFVGWATSSIEGEIDKAPEFFTSKTMDTEALNFYAVFATENTSGGESTVTLANSTIKNEKDGKGSYSNDYNIDGWTGRYLLSSSGSTYFLQLGYNTDTSKSAHNSHLTTPESTKTITSITINTNSNTASGRTFYLCDANDLGVADSDDAVYGSGSLSEVNGSVTINVTGSPTQVYIYPNGTSCVGSVSVTYSDVSYADYCTTISQNVIVSEAGWATACLPFNAKITSENATAYYVTGTTGENALEKKAATVIPAGEGVLLKSDNGGKATVTFTASAEVVDDASDNLMVGSLTEKTFDEDDYTYYVLTTGGADNKVGFYWDRHTEDEGASAICPAGKAVLAITTGSSAKSFFSLFDDATGIKEINNAEKQDAQYNLNGVRVNGNYKGIVIINGKKVVK